MLWLQCSVVVRPYVRQISHQLSIFRDFASIVHFSWSVPHHWHLLQNLHVFTSARQPCVTTDNTSARHALKGRKVELLLILASFGDHTVDWGKAVIEHVWVNGRDECALCDFWIKSCVAPNRECKIDTWAHILMLRCLCLFRPVCVFDPVWVCACHTGILSLTRNSKHEPASREAASNYW